MSEATFLDPRLVAAGRRARNARQRKPSYVRCDRRAGDMLFTEADSSRHVIELIDGVVILWKGLSDGRRQIVDLVRPGHFFGFCGADQRQVIAQAATNVRYRLIPKTMIAFDRDLQDRLHQELENSLIRQYDRALLLGRKSAPERVASFLLEQARLSGLTPESTDRCLVLPLSRAEMADYLGLVIETVSRSLMALQSKGVITFQNQRRVEIDNWNELEQIAGPAPT